MSRSRSRPLSSLPQDHYFVRSRQPLHALMFLLPLIVVYEIGAWKYANEASGQRLAARYWLQEFLQLFGAAGEFLPGLAVVVVLVSLHLSQRKKFRFSPGLYAGMALEALVLAVPLILFSRLTGPHRAAVAMLAAGAGDSEQWRADMILSIGAGIYEELVFRMVLIVAVHFVACDVFRMSYRNGATLAILVSAGLFALAHFHAQNPFSWPAFAFYAIAGFYFALIYLLRGFGIVVGAHAVYDVLAIAINAGLFSRG